MGLTFDEAVKCYRHAKLDYEANDGETELMRRIDANRQTRQHCFQGFLDKYLEAEQNDLSEVVSRVRGSAPYASLTTQGKQDYLHRAHDRNLGIKHADYFSGWPRLTAILGSISTTIFVAPRWSLEGEPIMLPIITGFSIKRFVIGLVLTTGATFALYEYKHKAHMQSLPRWNVDS
ncbi:MAG: hypothetical protein HY539_06145 [Deltaproteobacteria bacterium]|nr:hypothetical protein [Deltaproteobacteria bacterium]